MEGSVSCGKWIKRLENVNLVVLGKSHSSKSTVEIFSYDPITTSLSSSPLWSKGNLKTAPNKPSCERNLFILNGTFTFKRLPLKQNVSHDIGDGNVVDIAVHPNGETIVCSTTSGDCILLELFAQEMSSTKLSGRELPALQGVGLQNCIAFSVDGCKLAIGGEDGHLRIFEWPSMCVILDEPNAHKSFRFMDFSLDSEFLASTSTDGSARVWNATEGVPVITLTRNPGEKIELCRFSKDGTKPFLFCTMQKVQKANSKSIIGVWDMSTWKKIGHKQLLAKPASILSTSPDGKYLALGSKDGDFCVVEVNKMSICHWSRRLHPGTLIGSLEFCPSERVVLTTTKEWGAKVTKLTVPPDWKEWQIYSLLLALVLVSAIAFYVFYVLSDSFWQVPVASLSSRPEIDTFLGESKFFEDTFGPLDL